MKLIFRYIKRHIGIFLISTAFLTMEALADLLQPTFMSYIVDNGVKNADLQAIGRYGLIMLGIAITGALCAMARNYFASITSQTIGKELRHDMYENVQSLSLENIDRLKPASIITRLTNDVTQIQDFINGLMRMMVKAPITCIGAITLIIIQTPRQAPIIGVILVIAGILIFCNIRIGYPKFGNVQRKLDKLNGVSREFLSSVRVVKAFRAEDEETVKFGNASGELAGANVSALRVMAVFTPFISLTVNFGIVLLLWISGSADASHIGRLMASVNYMSQVLFALNMISFVINNAVRALASSERISEVLDEKPAQKPAGTATLPSTPDTGHILSESNAQKPEIQGEITFDHVSFGYSGSHRDTLKDLAFTIPAGKTVGIIGPTGSGKTTLVNLVPRFYDVTGGALRIDGVNVNDIDEKHLRNSIAVVPQKALLFTGTIADNLRFGRKDASLEELKEAARIACASEFIEKTKDGYDSILGQGGVNLSGGQKQRLSLCRALIRKPRILILDDCTSALDSKTEAQVLSGLRALTEAPTSSDSASSGSADASASSGKENATPMTVLLISQRISTVRKADMILCLSGGEMKGFGSHEKLMASCKEYRAIYESQIGGSETSSLAQNGGEIDGQ